MKKTKSIDFRKQNARLAKLSPAEKRVAIAKDALKQIGLKTINIGVGSWAEFDNAGENVTQATLHDPNAEPCRACALGAALVCSIRLFDDHEITDGSAELNEDVLCQLRNFFSDTQLQLIENAFEWRYFGLDEDINAGNTVTAEALEFGRRYKSPTARAKAIFTNIVKNKGEFVP